MYGYPDQVLLKDLMALGLGIYITAISAKRLNLFIKKAEMLNAGSTMRN
jgi:hypothetical protein